MKSILAWIVALIAAVGLCPITAKVVDLDYKTDTVTIEMANGYQYAFEGCSDYCVGYFVSAIVWRNGTDIITEDIIVSVHYSGYSDYAGDPLN